MIIYMLIFVLLNFIFQGECGADRISLIKLACARNPRLDMCDELRNRRSSEMVTPPPLPVGLAQKTGAKSHDTPTKQYPYLTPEQTYQLQLKCSKVAELVQKHCKPGKTSARNAGRCAAYFRDCSRFVRKGDALAAIANSFDSGVNINLANVDVKGIPYYPINEEGAVGVGVGLGIPFGAWGGGFSDSVGVRDFWHQDQEVGANWYDGQYGYKNHWSMPLVQSLGVEGGQHNTVSFPLHGPDAGKLKVDNGYGVGGYYQQNDHVGVDVKEGNVKHTFGVGSPFVGVGVETGQAVAFPGLDVWERALG